MLNVLFVSPNKHFFQMARPFKTLHIPEHSRSSFYDDLRRSLPIYSVPSRPSNTINADDLLDDGPVPMVDFKISSYGDKFQTGIS